MARITIAILILSMLLFGYEPTPAPPLDDAPFTYDPNQCLSEPMLALIIRVGSTHTGELKVTERDADPVLITFDIIDIRVPLSDVTPGYSKISRSEKDPDDPCGMSMIQYYEWSWTPGVSDIGLHYVNVKVCDGYLDGLDERTIIILVKENRPPVITGCR